MKHNISKDCPYPTVECISDTDQGVLVDNNLSVYEIMENESLFHDTTRQRSGVE